MTGYILLAILAMALSVPLFLVFGAGSAAIAFEVLGLPLHTLMQVSFDAMTKQVLVSIPIFIFAGAVMLHGGSARRLVDLGMAMVGHLPGGMAVALILAIGIFSAISGSILASIVAIGSVMMPPMIEKGYPKPFVVVLTASAALIDALIPPSNTAIIFSAITHVPVSKTFAAGVFPGLVLMGLLLVYSMWYCRHIPRSPVSPWGVRVRALIAAGPALLLPVLILGGLYQGFMTPAESASVASIYAILLGLLIYRELTWQGTFLEVVPVFYLTVPVFYPLCLAMKIDPLQFYVYMVGLVGLGMLTPPVCVGLYTASAVIREPPSRAFRAVPGFMLVGLVYAGIVMAFPWLSVWLPRFM